MFPRLPARATFVAESGTQKVFLILFRNIVSRAFARPRNIMSNNVSSFARAFTAQESHCQA